MSTHQGSCHCGQVQFEITAPVDSIVDCNCSICVKKGIVHIPAQDHELKILRGEEHLSLYQFKSNTAYHWFCTHCGIHTFGRPRSDPTRHTVNARCLDDYATIRANAAVREFDGVQHPADA